MCNSRNRVDLQLIHKFIKDVQYLYRQNTLNAEMVKTIDNKTNACNNTNIYNSTNNKSNSKSNSQSQSQSSDSSKCKGSPTNINTKNNNNSNTNTNTNKNNYNVQKINNNNNSDVGICNLVTGLIVIDRPPQQHLCQQFHPFTS